MRTNLFFYCVSLDTQSFWVRTQFGSGFTALVIPVDISRVPGTYITQCTGTVPTVYEALCLIVFKCCDIDSVCVCVCVEDKQQIYVGHV